MSPTLVDVVLILVIAVYVLSGWRSGFVRSALSILGFFIGAALAVRFLPDLLGRWSAVRDDATLRVVLLVVGVLLAGSVVQSVGQRVGGAVRARLRAEPARTLDSAAGAVIVGAAAAVVLFLLASSLRLAASPSVAAALSRSSVLGGIEKVVPDAAGDVLGEFRTFLSANGFPQVFGGGPEPIPQVAPPASGDAASPGVQAAARSILKVTALAPACGAGMEGTGWVSSDNRVVTNAHVVAGAARVAVEVEGRPRSASVVWFDPETDLAVLAVDGLGLPALPRGEPLSAGEGVVVAGYPLNGPYTVSAGRLRSQVTAVGRDIYGTGRVTREVYSVRATVQPGNSGGPLLDDEGAVVGVVFAKSLEDAETGYALTLDEVAPELASAPRLAEPVATGGCVTR